MTSAVMPTYARAPVAFVKGEGCRLTARDGRTFLDFAAGIAVCALGHAHPRLVAALHEQAQRLWHCSNLFEVEHQESVAAALARLTFGELVFFANSGAEANECAIKIARRHHAAAGHPERFRVLAFKGSFHGRTLATLAAAGNPKNLDGFGPVVDGFDHAPYGDLAAATAAVGPHTAAILVEPIQGEGGIKVPDPAFLKGLRALADKTGALLMFDEVQCGMGRSGALFAHQRVGVAPDVMTVAKGLAGGFPVAACVATRHAAAAMTAGSHASTFGGNPLAMAVGNAVLDVMLAPGFMERVQRLGSHFRQQLAMVVERHGDIFAEVRGDGLMLGLRCRVPNTEVVAALRARGLLTVGAGDNVVRVYAPLIAEDAHVAEGVAMIEAASEDLRRAGPKPA